MSYVLISWDRLLFLNSIFDRPANEDDWMGIVEGLVDWGEVNLHDELSYQETASGVQFIFYDQRAAQLFALRWV